MASPSAQSRGMFPNVASTDDDAGKLTTSFAPIVGLGSARTAQLNVVATFAAESDTVIIQVERNGNTVNLSYDYSDFDGPFSFLPGTYRLAAYTRGFGITAARIGLSSTATVEHADFSAIG